MDSLERLKQIDKALIHEKTRISLDNIRYLLDEEFSRFSKVQGLGFISILEREFGLDLTQYRTRFLEYIEAHRDANEPVFEHYEDGGERRTKIVVIIVIVSIVAAIVLKLSLFSGSKRQFEESYHSRVVDEAKEKISRFSAASSSVSSAVEQNQSMPTAAEVIAPQEDNATVQSAVVEPKKIVIFPKRRVWMGSIALESGKKEQKIIDNPYELNTSYARLIVFGHGYLDIEEGEKLHVYNEKKKLRFLLQDDKLERIDKARFRALNGGKIW